MTKQFCRTLSLCLFTYMTAKCLASSIDKEESEGAECNKRVAVSIHSSTSKQNMFDLLKLPDEIIIEIFSHLNKKDIPSVSRSRKEWCALINDSHLWKSFLMKSGIMIEQEKMLSGNTEIYKNLIRYLSKPQFYDLGAIEGCTYSSALEIIDNGKLIEGSSLIRPISQSSSASINDENFTYVRWKRQLDLNSAQIIKYCYFFPSDNKEKITQQVQHVTKKITQQDRIKAKKFMKLLKKSNILPCGYKNFIIHNTSKDQTWTVGKAQVNGVFRAFCAYLPAKRGSF